MTRLLYKVIKKVIFAILLLYGLNLITSNLNIIIPINYITIGVIVLLGIPGLASLLTLFLIL